jgi:hypothetical protein
MNRIVTGLALSAGSMVAVGLTTFMLWLLVFLPLGAITTAPSTFWMVNWRGLIALAVAVLTSSLVRLGRNWWWLICGAPLTVNRVYWVLKSIYFPHPAPPDAGSLYFEPEPFLAVISVPTIVVAMVVGYNLIKLWDHTERFQQPQGKS